MPTKYTSSKFASSHGILAPLATDFSRKTVPPRPHQGDQSSTTRRAPSGPASGIMRSSHRAHIRFLQSTQAGDDFIRERALTHGPQKPRKALDRFIANAMKDYRLSHTDPREEILRTVFDLVQFDYTRRVMEPVYEQALAMKDITAWVCEGEHIATDAAEFLKARGFRFPRDLSLASFHDDKKSIQCSVTS